MLGRLFKNKCISRFSDDESGVTLVEYGIALLLAITVGVGGLTLLSVAITERVTTAEQSLN